MTIIYDVTGHKGGGGKQHTPQETPDSLHSLAKIRILLALGEGEFESITSDSELRQRVYLDGTPIQNADRSENFPGARVEFRPGTQHQDVIHGFSAVESEQTVGVKLEYGSPWVRQISDTSLDAVRVRVGIPAMYTNEDNGDLVGGRIDYKIVVYTDNAAPREFRFAAVGKTMSLYERDHRIELPSNVNTGWRVEVHRLTVDSTSAKVVNDIRVQSITEIIDARLRYPLTALLFVEFDAKAFQNIPRVSIKCKGRKVLIPNNYDPINHTYSGDWDGTFKRAWTDNPAWHWYDICITERFGLGRRIKPQMLNRYALYQIAQRCDQLVSDGNGGREIRFKNDMYIQSQTDAWTVLKDLAAIFAGMTWWGNQMLNIVSDQPVAAVSHTITNASVIDGRFDYASGSQKTRYSTFAVAYGNPKNHYDDAIATGQRVELVRRHKINRLDITAIGCTRESEAQRRGHWALISNQLDQQVSFKVGMEGLFFIPGSVVAIADTNISGGFETRGGRLLSDPGTRTVLNTDSEITFRPGDKFLVRTDSGNVETREIASVNGNKVTLKTALDANPIPDQPFCVDGDDIQLQKFRITDLEYDDSTSTFSVRGIEYNDSKYDAVDNGARLDPGIFTQVPDGVMKGPESVTITPSQISSQGQLITNVDIVFPPVKDAVVYEIQWRRTSLQNMEIQWGNDWVNIPRTASNGAHIPNVFSGNYQARVRAIGMGEISSPWVSSAITPVEGRLGGLNAPIITNAISGLHQILWKWNHNNAATDISYTELEVRKTGETEWKFLTNVPYPGAEYAQTSLEFGIYQQLRARVADKIGNLSDWSAPFEGQVSDKVDEYMKGLDDEFLTSEDGKHFQEAINTIPQGIYESMLTDAQQVFNARAEYKGIYAEIKVAYNVAADAHKAVAQLETLIGTRLDDAEASIHALQTAQSTHEQAFAQYQQTVAAKFGEQEAAIQQVQTATADVAGALAEYKTQVAAQFGQQSAAIEQKMTSSFNHSGGSATYSLKAGVTYNGTYYDAGMQLSVVTSGSAVKSRIAFKADQFYIMHPSNGSLSSAFIVDGGQVYIDTARIKDASINFAQITDTLQSNNFASGSRGWRIQKGGAAEFNEVTVRGNVYANDGVFNGTVYARDGVFTGTVEATSFVGDVANMCVIGAKAIPNTDRNGSRSWSVTFNDSSRSSKLKDFVLLLSYSLVGYTASQSSRIVVTANIGGHVVSRAIERAASGNAIHTTIPLAAKGVAQGSVTITVTEEYTNVYGSTLHPSVILMTRGTGSWSQ